MKKSIFFIFLFFLSISHDALSQIQNAERKAALNIINQSQFCALITIDEEGIPESRMMQTLPVEEDFVIFLGTNPNTQKINQIKNNPNVSVYYTESNSTGYVNIQGKAEIINSKLLKDKYWKDGWESFYPDKEKDYILIKINPIKLQLVSYASGFVSKHSDWRAVEVDFSED